MIGPWLALGGAVLFFAAILVAMNTSTGGTRSDYDDGSGFLAGFAVVVFFMGIAATIVELVK